MKALFEKEKMGDVSNVQRVKMQVRVDDNMRMMHFYLWNNEIAWTHVDFILTSTLIGNVSLASFDWTRLERALEL